LSAPPVVADILKGDKPLMDAIKTSLVNALSRDPEEPDEFEEAPHPEDFADDLFGATEHPLSAALEPLTAGKVDRPNPVVATFADGFMALRPVVATSREASGADQEIPELPREDVDDIVAANEAVSVDRPAERSIAPAEPVMSNVSVVTSSVVTRPVAAAERFQSLSAPKSLEDTIKEMLRPLLMQWLDENMPRIVNEALREEIATKGLLPSARDQRR
jgi:cell pole-organizing protein PopZ